MPRPRRHGLEHRVLHVVNRGNDRRLLFANDAQYQRFFELMAHTRAAVPLRILAYALMPNHWHLVVWPQSQRELSRFLQRLTGMHAARVRISTETVGEGHIYQGRFRPVVVTGPDHYVRVVRYVEANPRRAGLVERAEDWPWSSLRERSGEVTLLSQGPVALPPWDYWVREVNRPMTPFEVATGV